VDMSKRSIIATLFLVIAGALAGLSYWIGLDRGIKQERLRSEVRVDVAPAVADELLSRGETGKALRQLYLAKSNERIDGLVDGSLGKAYIAAKKPCLAQSFLESSVAFMEREHLESFSSYAETKALLERQSVECASKRKPS